MVVPYPPGIPVLMPGECVGDTGGPQLGYLAALEAFDKRFPGFEHDIHGVERDGAGAFAIECVALEPASSASNGNHANADAAALPTMTM